MTYFINVSYAVKLYVKIKLTKEWCFPRKLKRLTYLAQSIKMIVATKADLATLSAYRQSG